MWNIRVFCTPNLQFGNGRKTRIPSDKKQGSPRNVSERNVRLLIRTLKSFRRNNVHITTRSLVEESGLVFKWPLAGHIRAIWMNLDTFIFRLEETGYLVTMIKRCDCNLHVTWSKRWIQILTSGKMKFPFTWTGYRFFTSITREVVQPQTEPGCGENERRGWKLQAKGLKI